MPKKSYFEKRITQELGVTDELNTVQLRIGKAKKPWKIFQQDKKGNIRISVFTLDRNLVEIPHPKATPEKPNINNNRDRVFYITRLKEPEPYEDKDGNLKERKYNIPKGAGTYPFITPGLIEKFEKKEKIKTLVLTEGYFKAFKGYVHSLDIVGLSSISHYKQKDTMAMYSDVIRILQTCMVENVIILYDGDCRDISTSALEQGKDLLARPKSFTSSAENIRDLLKDFDVDVYFAHVKSEDIEGNPKGLDDLLIQEKGKEQEVIQDLLSLSRPGGYFWKTNISYNLRKMNQHFHFNPVLEFYNFHAEKIGSRKFTHKGTQYSYDDRENECKVIIPGAAKKYFRVGDSYYKFVQIPNKRGQLEKTYLRRKTETIKLDHGNDFLKHLNKYEAFCNVPKHDDFEQVINNCFNVYHEFEHSPEEGECPQSLNFIRHIFQEHYELGLDYLQLLYQQPTQILPILSLVSKENNTGKSTFVKWLKAIFTNNATVIGNEELNNPFNHSYASRLIIACEESFIEKKQIVEKIKALSTAEKIVMNQKGRDHVEIDFFGKFILLSNNEDSFVYASSEDIRYWVRKIPVPTEDNIRLLQDLIDEIPHFLHYLSQRSMFVKEPQSRMWFHPSQLRTEALQRLIDNSRPVVEKELRVRIREMMLEYSQDELELTLDWIRKNLLGNKYEYTYIRKILVENLKVQQYTNSEGKTVPHRHKVPYWSSTIDPQTGEEVPEIAYHNKTGRPYIFRAEEFVKEGDGKPPENGEKNTVLVEGLPF